MKQQEDLEKDKDALPVSQADDLIDFYHLKSRKGLSQVELEDAVATDLKRATGFNSGRDATTHTPHSHKSRRRRLHSTLLQASHHLTPPMYDPYTPRATKK